MKNFFKFCLAVLVLCCISVDKSFAQGTRFKYVSYIFPADSLKGFDETQASQNALAGGFFGIEYKVYMYRAKRTFINDKYGYSQPSASAFASNFRPGNPNILAAPCVNEDFEASPSTVSTTSVGSVGTTLTGWTVSTGNNINSCTMAGCCTSSGSSMAWVRSTPYACPAPLTNIPNSPFGGTKVLQMNDNIPGVNMVRIQQTFPVTSTNALFQMAYMAALNGSGHACCDQPFIKITMLNCANVPLACPSVSITPPGSACVGGVTTGWVINTSGVSYTSSWQVQSIDLTPYIGTCVTIQITVSDCDGGAHEGWAFVDTKCSSMVINVNALSFPMGTGAVFASACGVTTATVSAPSGLGPYNWNGPGGSGVVNNSNQSFTTSVSGNYTLTLNPLGSCAPITRTVNLQFAANPIATFNQSNSCTTYTFTNTGTGSPAVQTYSFVGVGAPGSFTTTSTTTVVSFPPSTTFTVIHTVVNSASCTATNSMVITVPSGPNPAFTTPSFTQCLTGNSFVFTAAQAATTHTFAFNPTAGAPATGFVNPYGPVSFTAPGTYTVTHTITNGGCTTQASSVVVINPQPTITATNNGPICIGGNLILTATGGGTYQWSGPSAFSSTLASPTIAAVTAANAGVYSLTVTSAAGCKTTSTTVVAVNNSTTTASNTGPYCAGATIQLNTPAGTSYTWSGPAAFASALQNPTRPVSTAAMSGTYSVTVNFGGCIATATTNVVVNPLPVPTATNNTPVCAGSPINFTGTGGTTYTWTGPGAFNSTAQNPNIPSAAAANAGTYTLTVTGPGGCTNTAVTTVTVNPIPVPVANNTGPFCLGSTINLTSSGGGTYQWTGPAAFASALQNPTIPGSTLANGGTYTVLVTLATCTAQATTNVSVITSTTSASNTGPYCAGATIQLNSPAATSYTWSGPSAFASALQNPTRPASTVAMAGIYTVTANFGGCIATATTNVIVNALPTPTAGNTGPYCPGNTIQLNGSSASSYTWSGPAAFASNLQNPTQTGATTAMTGVYTLTVTNASGCKASITTNVVVNPNPTPGIGSNSPICQNTNLNLTSNGGTTYSWSGPNAFSSALQNPTILNATPAAAGVYTVTATSLGCTGTNTINVNVLTPITTATNTGPYCAGTNITLNTPAATTYTWTGPGGYTSNAQNPVRPASTPAMSGTYSVIVTVGTCTAAATTTVLVNPLPVPIANSNSPVCTGNPITFTGSGGVSYFWGGPGGYTVAAQNPTIAASTAANAGTYTLLVIDANTCTNIAVTNVVVNPTPVIVVNNPTVCINQTINLTANGGATYAWSGPGGFTSAVQNPNIPSATAAMSGAYNVTVTSASGCTNTAVSNVGVFPLPTPAIASNTPCVGATLNLGGSGGAAYQWTGPNSFSSNSQNPNINPVTMLANGTYTLLASAGTCTAQTTMVITINPLPNPNIVTNSPVCIGFPINLTGSGGVNYAWSGPSGFTDPSQNPTIPTAILANGGTYTLTVTDANGCVKSTTKPVVVNPQPIVSASGGIACENSNSNLTSSGGVSYSWTGPGGFTSNQQNPGFVVTASSVGQYTVVVTDANTCTNTAVTSLSMNPAPIPNMVTNGPICIGNVLQVSAGGGISYSWTGPNGFFSTAQSSTIQASSTAPSGVYYVTVTDAKGCTATASINAVVNPNPPINITSGPNRGCAPLCVTFTAVSTPSATIDWIMGDGTYTNNDPVANTCYQTTGIFTITASVVDVNGCQNATTYTAQVLPRPVADFNYDPYKPIVNQDAEVHFTDASYGAPVSSWSWFFMDNASATSNVQNPTYMYTEAGNYVIALIVKTDYGCTDTILKSILVGEDFGIFVPNAFTVNGDGLNDLFYAKGFGIDKFEMNIFDRWGEKVFTSHDINEAWDGTYQKRGDKIVKDDTYTWIINVTNVFGKSKEFTGHITLIK